MNKILRAEVTEIKNNQYVYNPINNHRVDCIILTKRKYPKAGEELRISIIKDNDTIVNICLWNLKGFTRVFFGNNDKGPFQTLVVLSISQDYKVIRLYFPKNNRVKALGKVANYIRKIFKYNPSIKKQLTDL